MNDTSWNKCSVARPQYIPWSSRVALLTSVLGAMLVAQQTHAESPSIESFSPAVVERGREVDIKLEGAGFAGARDLVFYSEHLTCKSIEVISDYELVAKVAVAAACQLRNEPFRLLGRDGFSELKTLRVTPFPVIEEPPRKSREQAIEIDATNQTILGTLEDGDHDRYSLELQAGTQLTVEVEAVRLGSELLDTVLSIADPDGKVIQQVDDSSLFNQDPIASVRVPSSGRYVIEVHESSYSGGAHSFYALHVGNFPAPCIAYPAGGPAGHEVVVNFIGKEQTLEQTVALPADGSELQLFAGSGATTGPSSVPFRVSNFPNVLESEPNDDSAPRHSTTAPVAFNGILQQPGDVDRFRLTAVANERLSIEVFAQRLGSPADSLLSVLDDTGELLARNDDWGSHDSRLDFEVPWTGEFIVEITDKLAAGSSDAVVRIEITPVQPNISSFLPRPDRLSQSGQSITVAQGNRSLARIGVRRELVDGATQVLFENLPSGVHASPVLIPADQFWGLALLQADEDAELSGRLSSVTARCTVGGSQIAGGFEQVVDLVTDSADQLFIGVTLDRLPVAVAPPIPFSVHLDAPTTPLSASGSLEMRIKVDREEGFTGPIRIGFPFLPAWVVGEPSIVIPANETEGRYRLEAREQVEHRVWPIAAVASVDLLSATDDAEKLQALKGREAASELVNLNIGGTPVVGQFETMAGELGDQLQIICNLSVSGELPERMLATLDGLPNRVSAEPVEIRNSDKKIQFKLQLEPDAPVGTFENVICRLSGELRGWKVSYDVAANSRLQIKAPGTLLRGEDGRVLSRLEALRQKTNQ